MDLIAEAVAAWNHGKPFSPPVTPAATSMGTAVQFAYPRTYLVASDRTIGIEGAYSDDPNDPGNWTGGRVNVGVLKGTKYGISAKSYPTLDIKNLTRDQALAIYFPDFWQKVHAADMPSALAYQAFDFAVNSGPEQAIKALQRALGVADDGDWGEKTQAAAKACVLYKTLMLLSAERQDFEASLSNWQAEGKGWTHRNALNLRYAALDT